MRYRLRTLLILLAVVPPLIWAGWNGWQEWRAYQESKARAFEQAMEKWLQSPPGTPIPMQLALDP